MLTPTIRILLVSSLAAGIVATTADPFVGSWEFNPAKSTLIDQMRVDAAGANKYVLNFGGGAETTVADGTDQSGLAGTTVSISIEAPNRWKVIRKLNGRTLVTGEWKLSDDGTTLRDHFTQYGADGALTSTDYVYIRTAGRSGFTGTWETRLEQKPFELQITPWAGDGLSLMNTIDSPRALNLKFDGQDYPVAGPNVITGSSSSGRRVDKRTLEITEKIQGKVSDTRRFTLSPDHKTLTMVINPVGRSKPSILVFDRK